MGGAFFFFTSNLFWPTPVRLLIGVARRFRSKISSPSRQKDIEHNLLVVVD